MVENACASVDGGGVDQLTTTTTPTTKKTTNTRIERPLVRTQIPFLEVTPSIRQLMCYWGVTSAEDLIYGPRKPVGAASWLDAFSVQAGSDAQERMALLWGFEAIEDHCLTGLRAATNPEAPELARRRRRSSVRLRPTSGYLNIPITRLFKHDWPCSACVGQ